MQRAETMDDLLEDEESLGSLEATAYVGAQQTSLRGNSSKFMWLPRNTSHFVLEFFRTHDMINAVGEAPSVAGCWLAGPSLFASVAFHSQATAPFRRLLCARTRSAWTCRWHQAMSSTAATR
jgi:hypothetical protein